MADQKNKNVDENVKLDREKDILDIKKELPKKKSYKVLVLSSFIQNLKEDRLYLVCFIITVFAFSVFSSNKVKESEGAFTKKEDKVVEKSNTNTKTETKKEEKFDVTSYVGTYVLTYKLDKTITYNDSCEVTSYDYVYEIKKDNSINRYIVNSCFGNVLISSDTLGYINSGNTRNIGSKKAIYMFKDNKLIEIDGLTYVKDNKYKIGNEVTRLVDSKLNLFKDKFIVLNSNQLYLVNGNKVEYELVPNTLLNKSIYKTSDTTYRYFVYNTDEVNVCYEDIQIAEDGFEDKDIYYIYSIDFDTNNLTFKESVLEKTRKRSDGCQQLDDDITRYSGQ